MLEQNDLLARVRQRLANGTGSHEVINQVLSEPPKRIRTPNICGRCGNKFSAKGRSLFVLYHQRKLKNKWESVGQERLYLCGGCIIGVMAFIEGDF